MILKIEDKYYESNREIEKSQCTGCCFIKTNNHIDSDCQPYKFSRCLDENGGCIWKLVSLDTAEAILSQVELGD